MKQNAIRHVLGILILLVLLGHVISIQVGSKGIPVISSVENLIYDAKVRLTMPNTVDDRVVILDIDEKSLGEIGRWPWGRDRMAQMINKLFDRYEVASVGFDVVMSEPDESSGLKTLEALGKSEFKGNQQYLDTVKKIAPQLDYDNLFAESLKKRPVVLGFYLSQSGTSTGALPEAVFTSDLFPGRVIPSHTNSSHTGNLPKFQQATPRGGHFNPVVDEDGVIRKVPLLAGYNGKYYESLSLAMVRSVLGTPPIMPVVEDTDTPYVVIESLRLPTAEGVLQIPVDGEFAALVPYRGYRKSYQYYSIADVLADRIKPEQLKNKMVLVGSTAPGLMDIRATPVGEIFPGVEVHANLITGMLDGTIKEKPKGIVMVIEVGLLLVTGLLMIFWFPWKSPILATLATLVVLAVTVGANLATWEYANYVVPLATSLLLVSGLFVLNMSSGYFLESKAKRQMTQRFGQYVPPELVAEMSRDPETYSMAGRKAELTVLFSDVRGFTTISEGMEPEQLEKLMNEYLTAMTTIIRNHRGTLDKYIGDAIMAFWGAPVSDAEHARHAVLTALEMQNALPELNRVLATRGWPEIKIGIGVNTGNMSVGDMGSTVRKAYTVMGDAVNLGARLESKTKEYGVGIMVGEVTRNAVTDILFRELDRVQVVGKEEPVTVYEPIGVEGQIPKLTLEEMARWNQALQQYRAQEWDQAEQSLEGLLRMQPNCKLYAIYVDRIAAHRKNPPGPDWTGVTRLDTK